MNRQRIEYIDFAKGFAILSIVIFHYSQPYLLGAFSKAIMIGGTGVHLFFVLSGFGLKLSSQVSNILEFYKKRFSKILIPYYFVILIIFAINLVCHIYKNDGVYALGGHLLLYKMFDERIIGSFGYHFWFISTIVQFYIIFPVIAYVKQKTSLINFLIISFGISLAYWILLSIYGLSGQRVFNSFFLQYLWEFSLGIALADLYIVRNNKFWEQNRLILLGLSILGLATMAYLALKGGALGQTFNDIPASIGYMSLSAFLYSICQAKFRLIKNIMASVGQISYELYLIHMLIFILLNNLLKSVNSLSSNIYSSLLFILPVSIFMSIIFMRFIRWFYGLKATRLLR
jgi:peptidoglycan/LPS O-acetylase OafA/YrhL